MFLFSFCRLYYPYRRKWSTTYNLQYGLMAAATEYNKCFGNVTYLFLIYTQIEKNALRHKVENAI